ncbi:hypothetical protein DO71_5249 [Burkholderia pseudomallei]|nr:hypothetical protein DO71_5249 [Burkholderia pseudomallei]KGD40227.1 hypothetical protein DO72_4485 [Burkholderia pseudomallei]
MLRIKLESGLSKFSSIASVYEFFADFSSEQCKHDRSQQSTLTGPIFADDDCISVRCGV